MCWSVLKDFKLSDGYFRRYIGNSRPAVIASSVARASPSLLSLSGLLTHNARGRPLLSTASLTTISTHPLTTKDRMYIQYSAIDVVSCNVSGSTFLLNSSACLQGHPICPCRVAALLFNVHLELLSSRSPRHLRASAPTPAAH